MKATKIKNNIFLSNYITELVFLNLNSFNELFQIHFVKLI